MDTLNFYFVRHAESEKNVAPHIICGRSNDIGLSPNGVKQCKKLLRRLSKEHLYFDYVYTSTAKRAIETFNLTSSLSPFKASHELLEMSQGDWEGQNRHETYTVEIISKIKKDPLHFKAPNGESQYEVANRMQNFFSFIIENFKNNPNESLNVGIYGHGFAFKCLLIALFDFNAKHSRNIVIDNTSISHLSYNYSAQEWSLHYLNDHSHLR